VTTVEPVGVAIVDAPTVVGTPSAPTNLLLAGGDARLQVTWDPPVDNGGAPLTNYRVTIKQHGGATVATTTTFVSQEFANFTSTDGIANGTAYDAYVEASNDGGTTWGTQAGPSNTVTPASTGGTPPSAPQTLTATAGTLRVIATWTAPASAGSDPLTSYRLRLIRNDTSATVWTKILPSSTLTTTFTQAHGVLADIPYVVTAEASNDSGGTWGAVAGPTSPVTPTPSRPAAPEPITASQGPARVGTIWTPNSDNGGRAVTNWRVRLRRALDSSLVKQVVVNAATVGYTFTSGDGVANGVDYFTFAAGSNDGGVNYGPEAGPSNTVRPQASAAAPKIRDTISGGGGNFATVQQQSTDVALMTGNWGHCLRTHLDLTTATPDTSHLTTYIGKGCKSFCVGGSIGLPARSDTTTWQNRWRQLAQNVRAAVGTTVELIYEWVNEPNINPPYSTNPRDYFYWLHILNDAIKNGDGTAKVIAGGAANQPTNSGYTGTRGIKEDGSALASVPYNYYSHGAYPPNNIAGNENVCMTDWYLMGDDAAIVGASHRVSRSGIDGIGIHPYTEAMSAQSRPSPIGKRAGYIHYNGWRESAFMIALFAGRGWTHDTAPIAGDPPLRFYATESGNATAPSFHNDGRVYPAGTVLFPDQGTQRTPNMSNAGDSGSNWNRPQVYRATVNTTTKPGTSGDWTTSGVSWNGGEAYGTENEAGHNIYINAQVIATLLPGADELGGPDLPAGIKIGDYVAKHLIFRMIDSAASGAGQDSSSIWRYGLYYTDRSAKGQPASSGPYEQMKAVGALDDPRTGIVTPPPPVIAPPDTGTFTRPGGGSWTLRWHDEFDDTPGNSGPTNGLDRTKWNNGCFFSGPTPSPSALGVQGTADKPPGGTDHVAYYRAAQTIPQTDGCHLRAQTAPAVVFSDMTRSIASGCITTAGLMILNPRNIAGVPSVRTHITGQFVIEIRWRPAGPDSAGARYWPDIWFTNAGNYSGGASFPGGSGFHAEFDMWEWPPGAGGSLGSESAFHLHGAAEFNGGRAIPSGTLQTTDMSLGFHTYTFWSDGSTLKTWVDGVQTAVNPSTPDVQAEFAFPQHFLVEFAMASGGAPTLPTGSGGRTDLIIDYVRVFS
jgi:hypothetical protein